MVVGIVLAAADSPRFGSIKQLADFEGAPLLTRAVDAMIAVKELDQVFVVLGASADEIVQSATTGRAKIVACPDWADGQSAPLRCGVATAADALAEAVVVTLGEQPLMSADAIRRVVACRRPSAFDAVVATYGDDGDYPLVFEQALFGAIGDLRGNAGAGSLLQDRDRVAWVPCDDVASPDEVHTLEDLQRLSGQARPPR